MKRLLGLLLVLAILAAGAAWWMNQRLRTPFRGFTGDEVFVEIPPGASESAIATLLADAGVIPDVITFRIAAWQAQAGRRLQAGEYRFAEAATPGEVVARLAHGDTYTRGVTFPEGLTIREMAGIFEKGGLGSAQAFELAASDGALAAKYDPDAPNLEGYLFPETYRVPRNAGAPVLIAAMLASFDRAFDPQLRAEAAAQRWSAREIVTLASLIEKETAQDAERPQVAAVYRNRLKARIPLQCDPTVIYALMQKRKWNGNLTKKDLLLDSPYNTYRYPGLPPGPIASPGHASLVAAVRPADVPYLYFVSRNDGTHVFASTLAEHERNVQRWQVRYFKDKR